MTTTQEIETLRRRLEEVEHERDELQTAIADVVEMLGHEGYRPADLRDAVQGLQRLLDGKDIDCGLEYRGIAAEVEALVWLYLHAGSDGAKTKAMIERLSCAARHPSLQQHDFDSIYIVTCNDTRVVYACYARSFAEAAAVFQHADVEIPPLGITDLNTRLKKFKSEYYTDDGAAHEYKQVWLNGD